MKLIVFGNVFGDFNKVKEDAEFIEADHIFICGNVGIREETSFYDYWTEKLPITQPVYVVTGKYEDFGLVKEISNALESKFNLLTPSTKMIVGKGSAAIAGVSGTYSEKYYNEDSAPPRHMTRKDLSAINEGLDIIFMHNVPGKLGKQNGVDFEDDFFKFVAAKSPRYLVVGGYGLNKFSFFNCIDTTVLFLPSINEGYAIIDTTDWSCYFNNKMRK